MTASDDKKKPANNRETPWPGGPRAIEQPPTPLPSEADPLDYFADSDLSEIDPNLTGLWPDEAEPDAEDLLSVDEWPPVGDSPQIPPRAWPPEPSEVPLNFVPEEYVPETQDENMRRSGLAYSAGIVFFGSVAFMLLIGWLADLLLGSSPFGLVAGIVIGSAIGFIQFFHISKQIYEPSNKKSDIRSLMSDHDDEDDSARL